jgi:aconitate hydratase
MPAGARVLPYRSNIPKISEYVFENIDPMYDRRALDRTPPGSHAIIAGDNYGQGSSREHAAIAPRYLGLRMVIAKSFARIHRMNLVNFGILPVIFSDPSDYDQLELNDVIVLENAREQLAGSLNDQTLILKMSKKNQTLTVKHNLFPRMIDVILAGGLTNWTRDRGPIESSSAIR